MRLLRRARADLVGLGRARRAARGGRGAAGGLGGGARQPPPLLPRSPRSALAGAIVARARRRPDGALDIAGEGPPLGSSLDLGDGVRLALFTSAGCHLCRSLVPRAERLGATIFDEVAGAAQWSAANVPGAPFAVALAADGTVLAKGTVNTRAQLASVCGAAQARPAPQPSTPSAARAAASCRPRAPPSRCSPRAAWPARSSRPATRRPFTSAATSTRPTAARTRPACRASTATATRCAPRTAGPSTTSAGSSTPSAPRSTRPALPLLDPDGRPQPTARRRRVCTAAGKRYKIEVRTDGAWYRCCDGHVRKLVDCCTTSQRRINGDRALKGYCYARRTRVLRHVLPDERAVLIALAVAALIAGVAGAWSPCGFSMVDTLAPHGYAQRMRTTARRVR